MRDRDGSIVVLEALLSAMLILSGVVIVTTIDRPTPAADSGGLDLEAIAGDTLRILQGNPAEDPFHQDRLTEIVTLALAGDASGAEDLRGILPLGIRYVLRLDNGVEPLHLLPDGTGLAVTPHGARAAQSYIAADWAAFAAGPGDETAVPGRQVTSASHPELWDWTQSGLILCIEGPDGSRLRPDGAAWTTVWHDEAGRIPADAPYGVWRAGTDPTCIAEHSRATLTLADGTVAAHPVYGVQLVVWPGA